MITVLGSFNMDLVFKTNRIPRTGETILGLSYEEIPGGKGANQAVSCAKLGSKVKMIGCLGRDDFGKKLYEKASGVGIDMQYVKRVEGSSGVAGILVDEKGQNSITVVSGANYEFDAKDVEKAKEALEGCRVFLTQLETPLDTIEQGLALAKDRGLFTILNPAPARPLSKEILEKVDLLTPNETELELLSNHSVQNFEDIQAATKILLTHGVKAILVTLGEKGSYYVDQDTSFQTEAFSVQALDTTAAGDVFNGALAVALSKDMDMQEATVFATKASAMSVTRFGAQSSIPSLEEVEVFEKWYTERSLHEENNTAQ